MKRSQLSLSKPRDRPLYLTLLAALAAASCELNGADDGAGVVPSGSAGSTSSSGSENGSTSGVGGSDRGNDEPASAGQGGHVAGPAAGAGQAGVAQTEPSAGGACAGSESDGACGSCLRSHCCSEWQACEQDSDCKACAACLDMETDLGACVVMNLCDIAPQATADALRCGLEACVNECGFD